MTTKTDQRIDIEDSGHRTTSVAMVQTGFVAGDIVEHVKIAFAESFGDRFGRKAGSRAKTEIAHHNEMRFLNMLARR